MVRIKKKNIGMKDHMDESLILTILSSCYFLS